MGSEITVHSPDSCSSCELSCANGSDGLCDDCRSLLPKPCKPRTVATITIPVAEYEGLKRRPGGGFLEVGLTEDGREVIINHPDLKPDAQGVGHIVFSPDQARNLARLLLEKADEADLASFERYLDRLAHEEYGPKLPPDVRIVNGIYVADPLPNFAAGESFPRAGPAHQIRVGAKSPQGLAGDERMKKQ